MNLGKLIIKGAASQFGREFGRAGANKILKGSNYYGVKNVDNDYEGRIKQSDSNIVKTIKEIKKIKFISSNKGNISRLNDMNALIKPLIKFNGTNTLDQLENFIHLTTTYNENHDQGKSLIPDNYLGKDIDYLNGNDKEIDELFDIFNGEIKSFITKGKEESLSKRKLKKIILKKCLFSLCTLGFINFQRIYLKQYGTAIGCFFLPFFTWIDLLLFLSESQETIDRKYNPDYAYYNKFSF